MREYGRHIQKMVEYLLTLEDREKRQRNAMALIELMGFLNPHLKNPSIRLVPWHFAAVCLCPQYLAGIPPFSVYGGHILS